MNHQLTRTRSATLLPQPHLEARYRPTAEVRIYLSDWTHFEHMPMERTSEKPFASKWYGVFMQCMAHWTCMCAPVRECGVHRYVWRSGSKKGLYSGGVSCCCLARSSGVFVTRCRHSLLGSREIQDCDTTCISHSVRGQR